MISESVHISERAAALRAAFDRTFVEAQHYDSVATADFLSIQVGGDPYMLRLSEIAGFFADKKVTRLPSRVGELSGVSGFRGTMLPVYDLAALLGYPIAKSARWMAITAEVPVALAFDSFDGHFRFATDAIAARDGIDAKGHLHQVVRSEEFVRPIIDIPSIVAAIRERAPIAGTAQEH
jgi:chemotaxis signal transduction protein